MPARGRADAGPRRARAARTLPLLGGILLLLAAPPRAVAAPAVPVDPVEPDARLVPWPALRRLALAAGVALPPCRPLSRGELATLLDAVSLADGGPVDPGERATLAALRRVYAAPAPRAVARGGRATIAQQELGDVAAGEAGLARPRGASVQLELDLAATRGPVWAASTPRLRGGLGSGGGDLPAPLRYEGWPVATWGPARRDARADDAPWRLDWPRAAAGARLGGWAVTAGLFPAGCGPGDGGGLLLDPTAPPAPALVLRRAAPFAWRGPLRGLAPSALFLRAGRVSPQAVVAAEGWSPARRRRDEPWLVQWLAAWRPAGFLTAGASLAALAVPRHGTLWPDLLQVAFPLLSATRRETERGPVTDRLFSVMLEARWRRAPWPLLPAAGGRVWWEYAGEDFNPPGLVPLLPQLSAPASVAGFELTAPRWDLAVEYAELEHPSVLWYAHSALTGGWAHDGWPLGHPLGGTGESLAATVRWRPRAGGRELGLRVTGAASGRRDVTPGRAERDDWEAWIGPADGLGGWRLRAAWTRERVAPWDGAAPAARRDWWRGAAELRF